MPANRGDAVQPPCDLPARQTIGERLALNARRHLVGRGRELATLMRLLEPGGPTVVYVHGASGIGKSTLLRSFAALARRRGVIETQLDGREVEPTQAGFLRSVAEALSIDDISVFAVARALGRRPAPALLTIENYELLGLLDPWLRGVLVPALPVHARLVIVSQLRPAAQWTEAPQWRGIFEPVAMEPLDHEASLALLVSMGVPAEQATEVAAVAGGHPLALTMAGQAVLAAPPTRRKEQLQASLHALSTRFIDGIDDGSLRDAVRAASTVRRVTRPVLAAMVGRSTASAVDTMLDRLGGMPFFERRRDGLQLHEAVGEALSADLKALDPERYRQYRLSAWRCLQQSARSADPSDLWRYTADLIYLINNPVVREAFFPRRSAEFAVEPARAEDGAAIREILSLHEPPASARLLEGWWKRAAGAFYVARAANGSVVGFYALLEPQRLDSGRLAADPLTASWCEHLRRQPMPTGSTALFLLRWLSRDEGERPSPVQAALWLDIKRHYMALRPRLRRVYLALADPAPYAGVAASLGMVLLPGQTPGGDTGLRGVLLDMGPRSVDGWLARLAGAELLQDADGLLDPARRCLRCGDDLVPLSKREYALASFLALHRGEIVSRDELLNELWGRSTDGSSNVVDALIVSLRRKLGARAELIRTVRGHGYMLRTEVCPGGEPG